MALSSEQLPAALSGIAARTRREPREDTVRIVEYSRFPRVGGESGLQIGFTRDLSASGLCIGADDPEPAGSLLRISLRDFDGRPDGASVARVVWCRRTRDGRFWIGLERLES